MKLKISEFFFYLLQRKNLYGRLATSLLRVAKPGLGTMAVGINKGRVALYYDPAFIENIGMGAAMFVLEHEMLHLMLDHIPRYLELLSHYPDEKDKLRARPVFNIAMDCAINSMLRTHTHFNDAETFTKQLCEEQHRKQALAAGIAEADIPPLPEKAGMCLPEKYDLPDKRSFEFYQHELMKRVNIVEISLGGGLVGDGTHGLWEGDLSEGATGDEMVGEANRIREQLKQQLRSAIKSVGGLGRGLLPAGVEEYLEQYLADPIVPWWEIFVTRCKASKAAKIRRSVTVPNRSLLALAEEDSSIIPAPGRVRDKAWRIIMVRDTSGSMSSESLEIALSEMQHMLNTDEGMELRMIDGDAAVHRDVLLHPGDEIPTTVLGRGGTDFDAYFEYMNEKYAYGDWRPDLVVVYTDGYAPAVKEENRLPSDIPVIWLVTPNYHKASLEGYGEIIVCDPSHNDLYNN